MAEYIDRDAVLQQMWNALYAAEDKAEKEHGLNVEERLVFQNGFEIGQQCVSDFPVADVVERKRGKWFCSNGNKTVEIPVDEEGYVSTSVCCSECMEYLVASDEYLVYANFCPNCGADMREDGDT